MMTATRRGDTALAHRAIKECDFIEFDAKKWWTLI